MTDTKRGFSLTSRNRLRVIGSRESITNQSRTQITTNPHNNQHDTTMASSSKKTSSSASEAAAYDAFNAVDKLVSKPVLGSDGASRWQNFRQDKVNKQLVARQSVAPMAPLKSNDRKAGFGSWKEERQNEAAVRTASGEAALNAGYTVFQTKNDNEEATRRKHEKLIRKRIRPEDEPYFISAPGDTFLAFKFDYVFTTKEKKTGYYWDGMDSVKKLDQGDGGSTDNNSNNNKESTADSSSAPTATGIQVQGSTENISSDSATKLPKKKKRKMEKPVIIDDPNNPMEQVAAAIQRRQLAAAAAAGGGGSSTTNTAWETAVDPTSGKKYYFCRATGERKWENPEPETLPLGWQSAKDPSTGKEYFYHAATAETRWERPSS
jgi:hypothetical protein